MDQLERENFSVRHYPLGQAAFRKILSTLTECWSESLLRTHNWSPMFRVSALSPLLARPASHPVTVSCLGDMTVERGRDLHRIRTRGPRSHDPCREAEAIED